jgi:uncharacterized protein (DUF736 family)
MNIIGTFKATPDGYAGTVRTLSFSGPVDLRAVAKIKDTAPDFHVYSGDAHIGAAWKATGEASGLQYVRVTIDDATLPEPLSASLFTCRGKPDEAELVWSRPRKAQAAGGRR